MISSFRNSYEKWLLALAFAALLAGWIWLWRQQPDLRRLRLQPVAPQLTGARYEPAKLPLPESVAAAEWPKPLAQSTGWIYEVFTPPPYPTDDGAPFGLEVLAVKPEPYRLQLAGYFGGPGDYLAAFVSAVLPETLLARAGHRFDALGLTLKSFTVMKVLVEHSDAWPVYEVAAFAVLHDDTTGADIVLDSRSRKDTDAPVAVLRLAPDRQARELHEGDTFSDDTATYRIERIQLDPPEVVVARQTSGWPQLEIRRLRPVVNTPGQSAGKSSKPFPERPVTALATANK